MKTLQETKPADIVNIPLSKEGTLFRDENPAKYMELVNKLTGTRTDRILSYILGAVAFPTSSDEEASFIQELFRQVLKARHHWSDEELETAIRAYAESQKPLFNRPRVIECYNCGADLTESFALALTADAMINDESVMVECPGCGKFNFIKATI